MPIRAARPSDTIRRGLAGQPRLWAQGISGDLPIVLVRIDDIEDAAIVRELLRAHEYWRMKGLAVDLVILNERGASYVQDLQIALESLVRTSQSTTHRGAERDAGGIFVLRTDLISAETRALCSAVARVVLLSVAAASPSSSSASRRRAACCRRPAQPADDAARGQPAARRGPASWSSSTASAASRPTAANT